MNFYSRKNFFEITEIRKNINVSYVPAFSQVKKYYILSEVTFFFIYYLGIPDIKRQKVLQD